MLYAELHRRRLADYFMGSQPNDDGAALNYLPFIASVYDLNRPSKLDLRSYPDLVFANAADRIQRQPAD